MARVPPLVHLGYGKFVRADRVYALVPLEGPDRGDGRRTLVHVEGIERADRRLALGGGDRAGAGAGARPGGRPAADRRRALAGQEPLF